MPSFTIFHHENCDPSLGLVQSSLIYQEYTLRDSLDLDRLTGSPLELSQFDQNQKI